LKRAIKNNDAELIFWDVSTINATQPEVNQFMVKTEAAQALNLKSEGKMTLAMLLLALPITNAQSFLNGDHEDRISVWSQSVQHHLSNSKSRSTSKTSSQSSHDSLQKRQVAPEVPATQELLKRKKTQHQYERTLGNKKEEDERLTA